MAPTTEIESELAAIWSEVLKIEKIGINDNFFRIGGDSIISIQLVAKARQRGIYFAVKDIFEYPTINGLSFVAKKEARITNANQDIVTGDIPLTPIQHWFFDTNFSEMHHFNQSILLRPSASLDIINLQKTFSILVNHHDALRTRYHYNQQWYQKVINSEEHILCTKINLTHIEVEDIPREIEQASTLIQSSLNLKDGPLVKAVLFETSKGQRLLIVIHHMVVDGVSWRIILEDLESIYKQISENKTCSLPQKTHSYQQWAKILQEYSYSSTLQKEILYWQQIEEHIKPLPIDFDLGAITIATIKDIAVSLTIEETTNLLQKVPKAYRTEINDILLTALLLSIGDWTNKYELSLSLEGHGREDIVKDIDLSRTVGWFTSVFPVHLEIDNSKELGEAIKTVKETLRHIPNKGIGYSILKYITKPSSFNDNNHIPTISFNYLGQWDNTIEKDNLFTYAQESIGNNISKKNEHSHSLDINGSIKERRLQIVWSYSTNHYKTETVEYIAHNFVKHLQNIITHCCQDGLSNFTTSDFNLNKTSYSIGDFPDFEPYVIINDSITDQNNLFIFPPGDGDSESYLNNIVPNLNDKKLILFNNYYKYLRTKLDKKEIKDITFEKLATEYIRYIKLIQSKGPYNFFGWSFGGTLAIEVARQLLERGDIITNIILVDAYFNIRKTLFEINYKAIDITSINYRYLPSLNSELFKTNIVLFKAAKIDDKSMLNDEYLLYKYYVKNTKDNNLGSLLTNNRIEVIKMDSTHFSWIKDNSEISKICKKIKTLLN